ncbi:uncharacterized protein LOC136766384 [Amia ocellicauda]|uniref:uncharacterized protein LOC136766384 n=1 Tax=Amia ocellicauda TaxID=2972642 RepID=UPI00346421E3
METSNSSRIFGILQDFRLQKYYNGFLELGVIDERDFLDSISQQNLNDLGLSHVEMNRFEKLKIRIQSLHHAGQVGSPAQAFSIKYTFPKCPAPRVIDELSPSENTIEDLIMRVYLKENISPEQTVCLYTHDGIPLTDDPFFNKWSLSDRHIANGEQLYAIFTLKENVSLSPTLPPDQTADPSLGQHTLHCHVMLRGNYEINVDLDTDTVLDLRLKLFTVTKTSPAAIKFSQEGWTDNSVLESLGLSDQSEVHVSLSLFPLFDMGFAEANFIADVRPIMQQSEKGISIFYSSLYSVASKCRGQQGCKLIALLRQLTGCHPLAQALYQVICRNECVSKAQKVVIVEGLYTLFREILPSYIDDGDVYEHANVCWAYLLSHEKSGGADREQYATLSLLCAGSQQHLTEPVRVPGLPTVFERRYIIKQIKEDKRIPGCSEQNLSTLSLQRASDLERVLLCLPLSRRSFPQWVTDPDASSYGNFHSVSKKSYSDMYSALKETHYLQITPPLVLKGLGLTGPLLVFLEKDHLGVYTGRHKMDANNVIVFDVQNGKTRTVDVDMLAAKLQDKRETLTSINTTRIPVEAILVLLDCSLSMEEGRFEAVSTLSRLDAVKVLFEAFANRTMAYNFHHIVGLVTFGGNADVKRIHTFTENLEHFKEFVSSIRASGCTPLYDALERGLRELEEVRSSFPDCRLRMLCLTDGDDVGSDSNPTRTVNKLQEAGIVVDAIIIGSVNNPVLHGISNVTGGCCFKPETLSEALKLFEMETVLSLNSRNVKPSHPEGSIKRLADLKKIFATRGYDFEPEKKVPLEVQSKVAPAYKVFSRKSKEHKAVKEQNVSLLREKRILEEIRELHLSPHPYCRVYPCESNIAFWQILMMGPSETPYENGVFLLYCQFGPEYPEKPPVIRFFTPIYHCNINSVGRICHNIFDRNYSAHVTVKQILDAVFGLLITPEPEDPLDSILAEQYMMAREEYLEEAKKRAADEASPTLEDMEKKLLGSDLDDNPGPAHLVCRLSRQMFVDPVGTWYGDVYERRAIEKHLKTEHRDPFSGKPLDMSCLRPDHNMKRMVDAFRMHQMEDDSV